MKKGTSKKKRKSQRKKREKLRVERKVREREEKMDKCSTGQKNPPLRKRHKKEKNNGHVSEGELGPLL
jgi:hypothetical protein